MKRKLFTEDLGRRWPILAGFGLVAAFIVGLFSFRLGGLAPESAAEKAAITHLGALGNVTSDLVLAPYKIYAWLVMRLPGSDLTNIRLASATITLSCVVLFYVLARRWHGRLNAAVATILFATSSWTLFTGRAGTGAIALAFAVLSLLAAAVWINKSEVGKAANRSVIAFALATTITLFAPGGIWFVLATCLIILKPLVAHLKMASTPARVAAGAIVATGLAGFIAACAGSLDTLYQAFGLPGTWPGGSLLAENASLTFLGFFFRGPGDAAIWLANTPLLDMATSALLLLGAILYAKHLRNSRTQLLASFSVIAMVLTLLNGATALSYLQPVVYLIAASGLAYLLHDWRKVFPRNPIAETVAVGLVGFMLLAAVNFHIQRYFVAWHQSPATAEAFQRQAADSGKAAMPHLIQ